MQHYGKNGIKASPLHQYSLPIFNLIAVKGKLTNTSHTVPFTVTLTVFSVVPTVLLAIHL